MKIDLAKFTKLSSNKTHTIFQHPDGHVIHVAHGKLSDDKRKQAKALERTPQSRIQVQKFADGGKVEPKFYGQEAKDRAKELVAEDRFVPPSPVDQPSPLQAPLNALQDTMIKEAPKVVTDSKYHLEEAPPAPGVPLPEDHSLEQQKAAVGQVEAGLKGAARAEANLGAEQAQILDKSQAALSELPKRYETELSKIAQRGEQIRDEINKGQIDPNRLWNSKSDAGKVSTVIGMILGGLGGSDAPVKFLQQNIDRDIESQKANLGSKQSLLEANLREYGNLHDAQLATKAMMMDATKLQLEQAAAKAKGPQAQAQAQQALGKFQTEMIPIIQQLAGKQALLGAINQAPSIQTVAKSIQFLPEKDRADATKELELVQGTEAAMKDVAKAFQMASGIGGIEGNIPLSAKKGQIDSIRAQLISSIRSNMKGQGTISDQEQKSMVEPLLPAAEDSPERLQIKQVALANILRTKREGGIGTLTRHGIKLPPVQMPKIYKAQK